jgi:hypothetical protein
MNSENSPKFVTMAKAVELLSQRSNFCRDDAAVQLIGLLNDAEHQDRPGLFEMDGAARKVVADPEKR